jgi:putative hydrolase of the HAD superfamily
MKITLAPNSADALLFDLGRVVIDFDVKRTLTAWAVHAGDDADHLIAKFARDETFWDFETGAISELEFFAKVRTKLGVELSDAQLLDGWNATFIGEMPGIAPLLARAAQALPLYAFSNTNAIHEAHFSKHYTELIGHFRKVFVSSTIGLRKPHAAAYDHVIGEIGLPAERIVFFDDLIENVEGARARGLRAVHVRSSADVADALDQLGL